MHAANRASDNAALTLVLLTNYFPFHRGEEYLETELPYLSEQFEQVVIAPVMYDHGMRQTRDLPANVRVVAVRSPSSPTARLVAGLVNLPTVVRLGLLRDRARTVAPHLWLYDVYFASRGVAFWRAARGEILSAIGPDRPVVIYSYWLYVTALVGSLVRREIPGRVTKFISRAHGYDVITSSSRLNYLPLRPYLVRSVDSVHPVSNEGCACLLRDVPESESKVSVRRLGVSSAGAPRTKTLEPLNIISCSSLKPGKRIPLLVETLRMLSDADVRFRWVHFGGSDESLEALRRTCAERLPEGTWWLAGHVPNSEVVAHLDRADVSLFVNLSESEGVPVSIMEAMAAGVPVLATAAGGTPDIVKDRVNGVLLPVEVDATQVSNAILEFARQTPAEFDGLSRAARKTWAEAWRADHLYAEFARMLADPRTGETSP